MNKYTLVPDNQMEGQQLLQVDGIAKACPFHMPMQIPGRLANTSQLVYRPCGTWCTLFRVHKNTVVQSCGDGIPVEITEESKSEIILP